MKRNKGLMEWELYRKIIDEMVEMKGEIISLHFLGESLIHPKISEFIAYAVKNGITTNLNTNGTLLTREKAESLFAAGLDYLLIDFDGDSAESYENIRKNAKYSEVLSNIQNTIHLQKKIRTESGRKKTTIFLQTILFPSMNPDLAQRFTPEELRIVQLKEHLFHESFNSEEKIIPHRRSCYFLWHHMTVLWDGTVAACCSDYDGRNIFGDLKVSSIHDVWNGIVVNTLREKHRHVNYQDVSLCNSCSIPNLPYFSPLFVIPSLLAGFRLARKMMPYAEKLMGVFR